MRIGIAYNPKSGARQGERLHRMIKASIVGSGHKPVFLDSTHVDRIEDRIDRMIHDVDIIAAIGGDGTINGVVNGILSSSRQELPVAFFPSGRGRDTARAISSFSLDTLGKQRIDWGNVRQVDVGRAESSTGKHRYFINISSIGLSAEAARIASVLPRQLGSLSYVLGAARAFMSANASTVRLRLDDNQVVELDNVLLVAICNGRSFGGGIYIAPDASPDDGMFEIVTIRNANLLDLLKNLPKLRKGTKFDHPALCSWTARTIQVDNCSLAPIDLDGELWGTVPITYSALPSALTWIEPRT
jgi:YegS/Rv2252/BmrU family lipid kinase